MPKLQDINFEEKEKKEGEEMNSSNTLVTE